MTDAQHAAETATAYMNRWGGFNAHEKGLLGMIWPNHSAYVTQVQEMLRHLADLTGASSDALRQMANGYERTDQDTAATLDATYDAVPRPPIDRD
ncbi:hypothetical protein GCM10012284_61900 [Mangrovihabitans endophyticus]|uniref:Excreted virulence factor EspC, type VII ESX diderm n=1 Tax=Mangrovihabitans endophyticus TaxID=1751298 RepID=A0A8J3FTA5_9ACTN|nr:hypothetical protein GCM10012284_61900 [Mangrovihabitans endophyticus]